MTALSVIIPARDAAATIGRTLECLAAQELDGGFDAFVIDDGSSDDTVAIAEAAPGSVTVLRQKALGPAEARNRGAAASGAPLIAFLDADCFPQPGWLAAGVRALASADLVQGHVRPDPDTPLGAFDRSLWVTSEVGLWETANLFTTREVLESAGGFEAWLEPDVGKALAEDVWFGWKAIRGGARPAFCEEALVHHAVFPRGPVDYVLERRRLRHFPELARKMPELRERFFHRRWFLSPRSAVFDAAVAGLVAGVLARSPLPLAAAAPYARLAWTHRIRRAGRGAPVVALADLAADALSLAELLRGSARSRTLLL